MRSHQQSQHHHLEFLESLFEKAVKGHKKSLDQLLEEEKPLFFDYALRMTGDITRSLDAVQESLNAIDVTSLNLYKTYFVFRQAVLQNIRKRGQSLWHSDTSRLENGFYLQNTNADTENLKDFRAPEPLKIRDFEREYHTLSGWGREALWLKARLDASLDQVAQVMDIKPSEVEKHLVHALFRLENHSYGHDPESLVSQLPLHPLPSPVSNVTMDLSMVMQGIKSGQKAPKQGKLLTILFCFLGLLCGIITAMFLLKEDLGLHWLPNTAQFWSKSPSDPSVSHPVETTAPKPLAPPPLPQGRSEPPAK
jgi:DNA-directed RNA polymerase specialized sigma24 family protein